MLEVDMKTTIRTLYKKGYNKTQIGRMLGIDRKTVRKVLKENEEYQDSSNHPPEQKAGIWPSMLDDYREFIEIQLTKELSITRIPLRILSADPDCKFRSNGTPVPILSVCPF